MENFRSVIDSLPQEELTVSSDYSESDNHLTLKWIYSKSSILNKLEISYSFKFDMDSLIRIIESKQYNISKDLIERYIANNFSKAIPLVEKSNYKELANLIINERGRSLGSKLGIINF